MKEKKLNVLLGVTEHLKGHYKRMINDYNKYFLKSQGAFRGIKKTYQAVEGAFDDPGKRGVVKVTTTVPQKLDYFIENATKYIDTLFSQEKTNAMGMAVAPLIVQGETWGTFTSLELLRLKSLLESGDLGDLSKMIENIPVRSDAEIWTKTENEDYSGMAVYETPLVEGPNKTTEKVPTVLEDPNLKGRDLPSNYTSPMVYQDKAVKLGDYTSQVFSGEWSHRERALCLRRRTTLLTAITEALKVANDCEVLESEMKADKLFNYLFYGK